MGISGPAVRFALARFAYLIVIGFSSLACDSILGIDAPASREASSGASAGGNSDQDQSAAGSGSLVTGGNAFGGAAQAGEAGEAGQSALPIDGSGTTTCQVGLGTPAIVKPMLLSACPSQVYDVPLALTTGDGSKYSWSSDLPSSTGLKVDGPSIRGTFVPTAARQINFTIGVKGPSLCPIASLKLQLQVEAATAATCAEINVAKQTADAPLPEPCAGSAYSAALQPRRGIGPFTWTEIAQPPGLSFEKSNATLSGIASLPGAFTVQLLDENTQRIFQRTFELTPREKCWLAYLSNETGNARLHWFDPVLESRDQFPSDAVSESIIDFKFSPDGRYLAYRAGNPAGIYILRVASRVQQRLALSNATHYAWSPDSATLAIVYEAGGKSVVGGAQINLATEAAGSLSVPVFLPTAMELSSEPVWIDATTIAFLHQFFESYFFLGTSKLTLSGFLPAKVNEDILLPDTQLRPGASGIYAVPTEDVILFYGNDGSLPVAHDGVMISPSGRYTARAKAHSLSLFRDRDDSSDPDSNPYDARAGCDTILAWASGRERIACAEQTPTPNDNLRLFEVGSTDLLEVPMDAAVDLGAGPHPSQKRRRLFSTDGSRFAFSSDEKLSVVTLDAGPPKTFVFDLDLSTDSPNNAFAELAFSREGRYLLQHRGARLSVFDLDNPMAGEATLSEELRQSLACVENFRDNDVGWCGAVRPSSPYLWSPNSDFVAFQTSSGALQVSSVTAPRPIPIDGCASACVDPGQFAFQP